MSIEAAQAAPCLHRRVLYALSHAVPLELLEVVPVGQLADAVVAALIEPSDPERPDEDADPCDCPNAAWCNGGLMNGRWFEPVKCRQYTIGFAGTTTGDETP